MAVPTRNRAEAKRLQLTLGFFSSIRGEATRNCFFGILFLFFSLSSCRVATMIDEWNGRHF